MEDFKLPMSALATVARRSFNGKFTAKIDFPVGYFMLQLLMLTLEVLNLSMHYLISIWTNCWCNLTNIVWPSPIHSIAGRLLSSMGIGIAPLVMLQKLAWLKVKGFVFVLLFLFVCLFVCFLFLFLFLFLFVCLFLLLLLFQNLVSVSLEESSLQRCKCQISVEMVYFLLCKLNYGIHNKTRFHLPN